MRVPRCIKIADKSVDEDAWLAARRELVTASDAPVLAGVGYVTPHQLLYDKLHAVRVPDNPWMRRGREAEPRIVHEAANGRPYRRLSGLYRSVQYPWMGASPDAVVRAADGTYALIEAKWTKDTRSLTTKREVMYVWQLLHQLVVCGYTRGVVAVSDDRNRTVVLPVELRPTPRDKVIHWSKAFHDCLGKRCLPLEYSTELMYCRGKEVL